MILIVILGIVVSLIYLISIEEVIMVGLWSAIIIHEVVKRNGIAVILLLD
jgi:hypothetical protein